MTFIYRIYHQYSPRLFKSEGKQSVQGIILPTILCNRYSYYAEHAHLHFYNAFNYFCERQHLDTRVS